MIMSSAHNTLLQLNYKTNNSIIIWANIQISIPLKNIYKWLKVGKICLITLAINIIEMQVKPQ